MAHTDETMPGWAKDVFGTVAQANAELITRAAAKEALRTFQGYAWRPKLSEAEDVATLFLNGLAVAGQHDAEPFVPDPDVQNIFVHNIRIVICLGDWSE